MLTVAPGAPAQVVGPAGVLPPPIDPDDTFSRILRDAVDELPPDVGVETLLTHGRPARRILEVAEERGCDLIVMGAHGHGRLHHALIGSVSDSVLRVSRLPVLLMRAARASPPATREPATPPRHSRSRRGRSACAAHL